MRLNFCCCLTIFFFVNLQSFAVKIQIKDDRDYIGHESTRARNDRSYHFVIFKGQAIHAKKKSLDDFGTWVIGLDYNGNVHSRFFGKKQNYNFKPSIKFTSIPSPISNYLRQFSQGEYYLFLIKDLVKFINTKTEFNLDEPRNSTESVCAGLIDQGWLDSTFAKYNICNTQKNTVKFYLGNDSDNDVFFDSDDDEYYTGSRSRSRSRSRSMCERCNIL